jgi:hypothetical protein
MAPGSSAQFKKDYRAATKHLKKHDADGLVKSLEKSKTTFYIKEGKGGVDGSTYSPKTKTINWNSRQGMITTEGQELSPATILNHEMDHANQHDKNPSQLKKDLNMPDKQYENKEEKRVIEGSERETATKLGEIRDGEVTRKDHKGTLYTTKTSTTNDWQNEIVVRPDKKDAND